MTQLTKEEIQFISNALSEISVSVRNPNARLIVGQTQNVLDKLNKMMHEIEDIPQPETSVEPETTEPTV